MVTTDNIIETRGLSVTFGESTDTNRVVDDVSFHIRHGEAYGLIGESGCGKSTILRAIVGLNPDYDGEIFFQSQTVPHRRDKSFFRRMQMVFQDPYASLHPRKIVHQVLAEPLRIHGLDRHEERISDVLEAVGLGRDFRFRYPHELSGGQRQRVAIARALIIEPQVLLLDEPTSALDVSVQAEILNLLKKLRRERGLTYLLVTHDLAVVAHICERIGMMHCGKIIEELSADEVRGMRAVKDYTRDFLAASVGSRAGRIDQEMLPS
ncbi:ABC transporter ATP-binding protein [Microvirga puerhi]|uniref:ABC transporter ATP-binding protein n=1 Tax=Microvirga puerhi TaxID=2876078 RepID=A0ABS7VT16_9HYPH|nr:ABC transporter ATP-binding protein [Microvirga puerhi]MBZ6078708.1 ABC transporter ATP-binding protein [Microvirga puerhi]